ncbi:FHA domain-containing protein [Dermacoccus nishinomiyaensis]|nr:FHA domain-containing protein [Dermacoccus sp. NHGro5]MCI0154100.1 FHA domain-containing protein [Dermacoccus nishinomiyaensis]NHC31967.1 FHA domain-containing protein [Dermacoccus nishinomiyaensis]QQY25894.1 FHA domain-containing protein [Dermacoccus nishinomiyaensis]TJZ98224.1 FHA domain-containing protein [Dermacoccus nishinomiyaensis]
MSPRERPWLKIDGQRYPLLGAITVLGRDDDADIVVDDPGVSRRHSEIRITHDGPHLVMSVRDLGSTNGTYVNGEHVGSTHVHDGDRLTLGRTPMTIHLGDRP